MEADSTTNENSKDSPNDPYLPFSLKPGNFKVYQDLISQNGEKPLEILLIERLLSYGLLPDDIKCPSSAPNCKVVWKPARVIDRAQWICEGCGKRQSIRTGSFFFKLQCTILQTLQIVLAWCEDADVHVAAQHFGVKSKTANQIFDKLDDLAIEELNEGRLGGENAVVLAEMYPDCLNRFSPDTTDQPHVHRILMIADTNHIPTHYQLHVIKEETKQGKCWDIEVFKSEVEQVIANCVLPNSMVVTGCNVPSIEGTSSIHQLVEHCDVDMQHFLTTRIWRQAVSLCRASRELCGRGAASQPACAASVQRYLHAALYRLTHPRAAYHRVLTTIARHYTHTHIHTHT